MKTYKIYFLILILGLNINSIAQISSQNGYRMSSSGTFRAFVIFAEAINDPYYNSNTYDSWPVGKMPVNPMYMIDSVLNISNIQGKLTKLFYQASFGELVVLGDYLDKLVKIDWNTYDGSNSITNYLNDSITSEDIETAHHFLFNGSDFDSWELNPVRGGIKEPKEDTIIDLVIVLWRVNSKLASKNNSGTTFHFLSPVKDKNDNEYGSSTSAWSGTEWPAAGHEICHSLLGSDAFVNGGNLGSLGAPRTTLPKQGGYGMLSYVHGTISTFSNGCDRWRLGWKLPEKNYHISALNSSRNEVETDLVYGSGYSQQDFILRDYVRTGDVIRIKLPILQTESSTIRNQYLWIENHQMLEEFDVNMASAKGIYAYIQVGYDDLETFSGGSSQYLTFLNRLGNYDMLYTPDSTIYVNSDRANPFTGYSIMQAMAYNLVDPDTITFAGGTDYIPNEITYPEIFYPTRVVNNGVPLPLSYYRYREFPFEGTIYDAFTTGCKIGLGSNPSSMPILTYSIPNGRAYPDPRTYDNRTIYLNGLSVEVLSFNAAGDATVCIRYNDFAVNNDVRWCAPSIVLEERVELNQGTITLDQGLTPTRPVNPIPFNGETIFSSPTVFITKPLGYFKMNPNTQTVVKNNSAFVLEQYGTLEIQDNSVYTVKSGSTLALKSGSNLVINGRGHIEVENGAYICIEDSANITLQTPLSVINLRTGYQKGVNPAVLSGFSCSTNPAGATVTGSGAIHANFNENIYVQNQTISTDQYISGSYISIGRAVDPDPNHQQGDVIIQSGKKVIVDAENDIILAAGLTINAGADFEMR